MNNKDLKSFVDEFDYNFLFVSESGSRAYGFADDSSDIDLRGVFIDDIVDLFSLNCPKTALDGEIGDIDYQFDSLGKFLGLLLKSNFNRIEWFYSPHKIVPLKFKQLEMTEIVEGCLSTKMGNHVRGWAYSMYNMNWDNPKKCLYAIRPLMVYINVCETGEFESNIRKLVGQDRFKKYRAQVNGLINMKENRKSVPETYKAINKKIYDELVKKSYEVEKEAKLFEKPPEQMWNLANEYYREALEMEMIK